MPWFRSASPILGRSVASSRSYAARALAVGPRPRSGGLVSAPAVVSVGGPAALSGPGGVPRFATAVRTATSIDPSAALNYAGHGLGGPSSGAPVACLVRVGPAPVGATPIAAAPSRASDATAWLRSTRLGSQSAHREKSPRSETRGEPNPHIFVPGRRPIRRQHFELCGQWVLAVAPVPAPVACRGPQSALVPGKMISRKQAPPGARHRGALFNQPWSLSPEASCPPPAALGQVQHPRRTAF